VCVCVCVCVCLPGPILSSVAKTSAGSGQYARDANRESQCMSSTTARQGDLQNVASRGVDVRD
jgi:hypothetical protein